MKVTSQIIITMFAIFFGMLLFGCVDKKAGNSMTYETTPAHPTETAFIAVINHVDHYAPDITFSCVHERVVVRKTGKVFKESECFYNLVAINRAISSPIPILGD